MKRIYRGFKTECPTGLITEEAFHSIYARFFPHGGIFASLLNDYPSKLNVYIWERNSIKVNKFS